MREGTAKVEVRGVAIASWAVLGVAALLLEGVVRLCRMAAPLLREELSIGEWAALVLLASALGYVEGYRGFVRSFSPRVVARAFELAVAPRPSAVHVVLAPLYAMSLVGDTRSRVVRSWCLVGFIVAMMVGVRSLSPVSRAIVDASVALSLTAGLAVLCALWARRVRRQLA